MYLVSEWVRWVGRVELQVLMLGLTGVMAGVHAACVRDWMGEGGIICLSAGAGSWTVGEAEKLRE